MTRHRQLAIPRLMHVGRGALEEVPLLLAKHDFDTSHVLVCSGAGPTNELADIVTGHLQEAGIAATSQRGLRGELNQAADVAARIISSGVTLAVAVGGGKVIDTVKLAAARTNTDFISVPTTIAHDGISSPVASLDVDGSRVSHAAAMPAGIIIDTGVIGDAPLRTLQAGAGDLLSNLTAILDWELAEAGGYDRFDAFSAMIAESAARPALDLTELESPQSRELLAKGLLLSGLAMASAGTSRPCSGAEHLISHSLDGYLGPRAALHGEQVAIGCLVSAQAHKSRLAAMLREVFLKIGLPTAPEEVGLDRDDLCKAIVAAPGTRPDRYTILSTIELTPAAARELVEQTFPH